MLAKSALSVIGLASISFCIPPCGVASFEQGDVRRIVLDAISWRAYWLDGPPFGPFDRSAVVLLREERHAGYCVEAWNQCVLFSDRLDPFLLQIDSLPFTPVTSSGVWEMRRMGVTVRRSQSQNSGSTHTLSAGGQIISDPLAKAPLLDRAPRSDWVRLNPCAVAKSMVNLVPTAIRSRRRPQSLGSLRSAIKAQGLTRHYDRVVIPYFSDHDGEVLLKLNKSSVGHELVVAIRRDRESWMFRPITELDRASAAALVGPRIDSASMVTFFSNGRELWSH
jgi:hypothetical protein